MISAGAFHSIWPGMTLAQREGVGAFSPASIFAGGKAGAFYDPFVLSSLTQGEDGTTPVTATDQVVGRAADQSGNANHWLQQSPTLKPLYKTAGGLHWLQSDGLDDYLRSLFVPGATWTRITAIRQIAYGGVANARVYGGGNANAGNLLQPSSGNLQMFGGSFGGSVAAAIGTDYVVSEIWNGGGSSLAINNGTPGAGDPGATAPGGWTFGASSTNAVPTLTRFYGGIMVAGLLTAEQTANMRAWCAARAGITL